MEFITFWFPRLFCVGCFGLSVVLSVVLSSSTPVGNCFNTCFLWVDVLGGGARALGCVCLCVKRFLVFGLWFLKQEWVKSVSSQRLLVRIRIRIQVLP